MKVEIANDERVLIIAESIIMNTDKIIILSS